MRKKFAFLFVLPCFLHAATLEDILPDPYPQVYEMDELMPFNPQGWYKHADNFEALIPEKNIRNIVEVGSWLGASTRHMATLLPPDGKVFAVDHWQGSEEHFQIPEIAGWIPTLYRQFLSNVVHAKLTDKIIPVRLDSVTAAQRFKQLDIPIDLIYIDGAHDYQSVYNDLRAWYPLVKNRGILCGDDYEWDGVRRAVKRFAKENKLGFMITHKGFWILLEGRK